MADLKEIARAAEVARQKDLSDRRRPGRAAVAPELVPLLRAAPEYDPETDDAAPMRGIALSVVLSAPIYAGLFMLGRWLLF